MSAINRSNQPSVNQGQPANSAGNQEAGPIERAVRKIINFVVQFFKRIFASCFRFRSPNPPNQNSNPNLGENQGGREPPVPAPAPPAQARVERLIQELRAWQTPQQLLTQFELALTEEQRAGIYRRHGNGDAAAGRQFILDRPELMRTELEHLQQPASVVQQA